MLYINQQLVQEKLKKTTLDQQVEHPKEDVVKLTVTYKENKTEFIIIFLNLRVTMLILK